MLYDLQLGRCLNQQNERQKITYLNTFFAIRKETFGQRRQSNKAMSVNYVNLSKFSQTSEDHTILEFESQVDVLPECEGKYMYVERMNCNLNSIPLINDLKAKNYKIKTATWVYDIVSYNGSNQIWSMQEFYEMINSYFVDGTGIIQQYFNVASDEELLHCTKTSLGALTYQVKFNDELKNALPGFRYVYLPNEPSVCKWMLVTWAYNYNFDGKMYVRSSCPNADSVTDVHMLNIRPLYGIPCELEHMPAADGTSFRSLMNFLISGANHFGEHLFYNADKPRYIQLKSGPLRSFAVDIEVVLKNGAIIPLKYTPNENVGLKLCIVDEMRS